MTCNECFEAFSCALDGELEPELQDAMNDHLESCSDCRHLRTRMLSLSADMKGQTFPNPGAGELRSLIDTALSESATVSWDWLRRLLRFPYENWIPRTGIRLAAYGIMVLMVLQAVVIRYVQPLYSGVEAASLRGLEGLSSWPQWGPSMELIQLWALVVFLLGAWTAGVPGLAVDLWSGVRLANKDLIGLGLNLALLGPVMALPMLIQLQAGRYAFACFAWIGVCALATYSLMVFKTETSLPKLAISFVCLMFVGGVLEYSARRALNVDGPGQLDRMIRLAVGHFSFARMMVGLSLLGLALVLGILCLASLIRSYRSVGGKPVAALFGIVAVACCLKIPFWSMEQTLPVVSVAERHAYILGSGRSNPWVLSHQAYPGLHISSGNGNPEEARARLVSAVLAWNESEFLRGLSNWADTAPGVTWGMSAFVRSLGRLDGSVLAVPTEERRKTVSGLLQSLNWRRLDDVVISQDDGVLSGKIFGLDGRPAAGLTLRLVPVTESGTLDEVMKQFALEQEWGSRVLNQSVAAPGDAVPIQYSLTTDTAGGFRFSHLPPGRYFLATLLEQNLNLTLNSSIPGVIELPAGKRLELGEIRLSAGQEGEDVALAADRWEVEGKVSFSDSSEGESAKLTSGAAMTGFVDTKLFAGGTARIKLSSTGPGSVEARFFSKDGRLLDRWNTTLSNSGFDELEIETDGREGYLQLFIKAGPERLILNQVKVEVLSRG